MPDDMTKVLNRITFVPRAAALSPIPWPEGLAPRAAQTALGDAGSLPAADVLVITWTAAEAMALADVLTPGVASAAWTHYVKGFAAYEDQLTSRSPAREAKRLGEFHMAAIAGLTVCCFHSQLHPATDGPSLPAAAMAAQIAGDTGARLVITTGTAGAVGAGTVLGDANVATAIRSDCTTRLAGHPWSQELWATTALSDGQQKMLAAGVLTPLFAANSGQLPKEYAPRAPEVTYGHTCGTDFFCIGTADDHYGLLKLDAATDVVEMDDFAIAFGLLASAGAPMLASVRNCSDPVMASASAEQLKLAEQLYESYGFATTASSAICCWALIAGLARG
jgi:nucleoside phosphorylase